MYNETSLQIQALELGDSGVYEARIKIVPATVEDRTFLLRVYEPVPAPEIESHSLSRTADGCNVSLQCQASGREEVNVSWTRGNPPRELGSSERYQLAPDGRTLRLSLQPRPLNSTFTCTASNPGDQKSISPDLQSICQSARAAPSPCHWRSIIVTLFLGLEINAIVLVNLLHRKTPQRGRLGQNLVSQTPDEKVDGNWRGGGGSRLSGEILAPMKSMGVLPITSVKSRFHPQV
ncbi:SLAM family member 6 [Chelydra serpentina]|uniref:SLAM family member 6 n=1 Tax=Chelydra serpentina TaxID=8475 RepID=A0A8T1SMR2_CHESE|nr:SLAM family member 6 [Chelydra serpentina]